MDKVLSPDKSKKVDRYLQELSVTDFNKMATICGIDRIRAYVYMEIQAGKTYGQISIAIGIPVRSIKHIASKFK